MGLTREDVDVLRRATAFFAKDPVTVYPFIEAEKASRRNVARGCALLKVSRAAFNAHLSDPSQRERDDAALAPVVGPKLHDRCSSEARYRLASDWSWCSAQPAGVASNARS